MPLALTDAQLSMVTKAARRSCRMPDAVISCAASRPSFGSQTKSEKNVPLCVFGHIHQAREMRFRVKGIFRLVLG
jgi:hypothetical protein